MMKKNVVCLFLSLFGSVSAPIFAASESGLTEKIGFSQSEALVGDWTAFLYAGAMRFTLVIHVQEDELGCLYATLDCREQGMEGFALNAVSFHEGIFRMEISECGVVFEGLLAADGSSISGSGKYMGYAIPLVFEKN